MSKAEKSDNLIDTIRYAAIGLSVILLIAGAAFMIPGVQDYFVGDGKNWKIEVVDFETLEKPSTPNNFLACPEYMCPYAYPDAIPPVYGVSAAKLRENLMGFVDTRPGVKLRALDLVQNQYDFSVWTQDMRSPDVVTIRLHDLTHDSSTLAIFARSPREDDDDDRNSKRAEIWLKMIGPIKDATPQSP